MAVVYVISVALRGSRQRTEEAVFNRSPVFLFAVYYDTCGGGAV